MFQSFNHISVVGNKDDYLTTYGDQLYFIFRHMEEDTVLLDTPRPKSKTDGPFVSHLTSLAEPKKADNTPVFK